jgi:hypothetical protein
MSTTYTLSIVDMRLQADDYSAAVDAACASLDATFGYAASVAAACEAHDTIVNAHGQWPLPDEATADERAIVERWVDAERAAERAAVKASGYKDWSMGGHIEITPQ